MAGVPALPGLRGKAVVNQVIQMTGQREGLHLEMAVGLDVIHQLRSFAQP